MIVVGGLSAVWWCRGGGGHPLPDGGKVLVPRCDIHVGVKEG